MSKVRRLRVSIPVSTRVKAIRLRTSSDAPTRRTSAIAISAATSTSRVRRARPEPELRVPPSASASVRLPRENWMAGMSPNAIPTASATATVNRSTRRSMVVPRPAISGGDSRRSAPAAHFARTNPATAPAVERTSASVNSCRTIRARSAPTARRNARSRRRAAPRPRSRLATLAQAIARTNATAPASTSSGRSSDPANC